MVRNNHSLPGVLAQAQRRAEKSARNISKNTTLIIPLLNIPAFKPANTFKEEVTR